MLNHLLIIISFCSTICLLNCLNSRFFYESFKNSQMASSEGG